MVAVLLALFAAASFRLFVWPAYDAPERVDAIVSLAGDEARLAEAMKLVREGYSHVLVVSHVPSQGEPCPPSEPGVRVVCFVPDPDSTRGEARVVGWLARLHHWQRIIIIPGMSQATRARLLFERCYPGLLVVVPVRDYGSDPIPAIFYEWGALAKAVVSSSC